VNHITHIMHIVVNYTILCALFTGVPMFMVSWAHSHVVQHPWCSHYCIR